jgi:hypothetical protein
LPWVATSCARRLMVGLLRTADHMKICKHLERALPVER